MTNLERTWQSAIENPFDVLYPLLQTAVEAACVIVAADVTIAAVHWAMDTYGNPKCPVLGKAVFGPNLFHHIFPRALLKNSCLKSSDTSIAAGALIVAVAWSIGMFGWKACLFGGVVAMINMIHRWSHSTPKENGSFITWLHKLKLIQTQQNHARHHIGEQNTNYAAFTNFVNPILEKLNLWRTLENLVEKLTGIKPRRFSK